VHAVAPAPAEKEPAAQTVKVPASAPAKAPGGAAAHEADEVLATTDDHVPGAHGVHAAEPDALAYVPTGHAEQAARPADAAA
jgi:hypothetical protein